MSPREYYNSHSKEHLTKLADSAGTTFGNFQQIALAQGSVSRMLAKRLSESSKGKMSVIEILFPPEQEAS